MVAEAERDKVNGLVGMVGGLGFAVTSVFSGLSVGQLGMTWTIAVAVALTVVSLLHLMFLSIDEPEVVHVDDVHKMVDFGGAFRAIRDVPGLTGLVLFACFNNLLGGVFMALLDPYGLTLVSVEVWGLLWGVLSFGFIIGAGLVARKGLGGQPLRALLLANVGMWVLAMSFTIRENIWLLAVGTLAYLALIPVAEAAEQTVLQKVVPYAKQGRVFGLAQSVEVFTHMTHIGDVRSLVLHPATTSHSHRTPEERDILGVQPGTLRLSVGIEDVSDLIADLDRVLEPAREAVA